MDMNQDKSDLKDNDQSQSGGSGRRSAASMQTRSRKIVFISLCVFAVAAIGIGSAIFAINHAESPDANKVEASSTIDGKAGSSKTTDSSIAEDGEENPASHASEPIESDSSLADDPRLKDSDSDNATKPDRKVVYLTFDDGPSDLTPAILETLEKNNVKATWFITGMHTNLDNIQMVWDAGHQIALHSNSHSYKKIYKSADAFFADMDEIARKIHERIGIAPKLIRFPGGSINSYNSKTRKKIMKELKARNWHYFD